jgi:hypothetical protein
LRPRGWGEESHFGKGIMSIDTLSFRLILTLIPGIIVFGIVAALAPKRDRNNFVAFLQILMYGISSYAMLHLIRAMFYSPSNTPLIFNNDVFELERQLGYLDIIYASIISLFIGIAITLNYNYSILMEFMQRIGITKRFSDLDVWGYTMNSSIDPWVTVRDNQTGLTYDGYISAYSPGNANRELLLSDVEVFVQNPPKKIDNIPFMYISFEDRDIILEFRSTANRSDTIDSQSEE